MALGKDLYLLADAMDYTFRDISFLETALTHASYANEVRAKGIALPSNERMEFLGDAVLQLVISQYLFRNFSKYAEGGLTKIRQMLVCEKNLSRVAKSYGIGEYVHLGNGEEKNGCRNRPKILADTLEAVFAAVYLDCTAVGDTESYGRVILSMMEPTLSGCACAAKGDYKTLLQQLVEKDGSSDLTYEILKEEGPPHDKIFTVGAFVHRNLVGEGSGQTIKTAEMNAAKAALSLFGYSTTLESGR